MFTYRSRNHLSNKIEYKKSFSSNTDRIKKKNISKKKNFNEFN